MKNAKEMQMEKIIAVLENAGVNSSRISLAESYLLGETELPDFDIGQKSDAAAVDYKMRDGITKICIKYLKANRYDEFLRLFHVVFELFYNANRMIPLYEFREAIKADENFKNMLPKEKIIVMLAEGYESYSMHYANFIELWNMSGESHQVLKNSLALCQKNSSKGMLSIYCTYFMFLEKTAGAENKSKPAGKNWGILGGLSKVFAVKENKEADNAKTGNFTEEEAELFKKYESLIVENCGLVFYNMPEDGRKRIVEYVKTGRDGEDIPDDIKALAGKYSMYGNPTINQTPRLLIGNCINNTGYSVCFRNFIRLCLYGNNISNTLDIMITTSKKMGDVDSDKVREFVLMWRKNFSPDTVKLICWCARGGEYYNKTLLWFADKETDAYREAIDTSSAEICGRLSELIKQERKSLYEKHYKSDKKKENMQRDIAEKFAAQIDDNNKNAVINYLLTGDSLENMYNIEKALMSPNVSYAANDVIKVFNNYISMLGKDNFSKRCVVFLGFRGFYNSMVRFFSKDGWRDHKPEKEKELFCDLNDMGLSITKQWQIGCGITQTIYLDQLKDDHKETLKDIFSDYVNAHSDECVTAFAASDADGRALAVDILGRKDDVYKKEIFEYFGDGSKAVKEAMVKLFKEKKDWMPDVLEKLGSKKAAERELAVAIIGQCGGYTEELRKALETEKSSKVAGAIRDVLGEGDKQRPQGEAGVESYVKELHKGGKKRALAWAYETPFTEVHMLADEGKYGDTATEEYMQAILLAYSSMPVPGVNKDVLMLTEKLNKLELAEYVIELFDKWLQGGAEAKKKWVLYAAGIHGGVQIVQIMKHNIDEWAKNSRGAIAAEAVKALALNDSPTALLIVDGISRKYKYRQVKTAAADALKFAAEQLGLSTEELADRIVPDLGFDENHERIFDYGERKFKVYITPALEIEIYDENNKKLKNIPAPGKKDNEALAAEAYAEFKQMKKQMKTTVANQKQRLEAALSTERKWTVERWNALFVKNPIMHQFAISLIWGIYEDGKLSATFRYMEDGSFNTEDEEEISLPEEGLIGLIHPIELNDDTRAKWEEQLSDYEIIQSIEQLKRPMYLMTDKEKNEKTLDRFGGMLLSGISLSSKLQSLGWYKGQAEDAGMYYYFYREDADAGIKAVLHFSGAFIADGYMVSEDEEVTVYELEFFRRGEVDIDIYGGSNKEKKGLAMNELSPKYFSEIVYQMTKATAASEETNNNWKSERD